MDLVGTIRKSGSRGGVNFSWNDVSTSQHRENYLGHSLMAPVGRWQKGRDLNWYAKTDDTTDQGGETAEEKRIRERKEEIRRIKEAEEDALARALGLPVAPRTGEGTGANGISLGEMNKVIKETEADDAEIEEVGKSTGFGNYVGKVTESIETATEEVRVGGLVRHGSSKGMDRDGRGHERRKHRRSRSRSQERRDHRRMYRSASRERHTSRRDRDGRVRRERSRSPARKGPRRRSRSTDRLEHDGRRRHEEREQPLASSRGDGRDRRRYRAASRSRSPPARGHRSYER